MSSSSEKVVRRQGATGTELELIKARALLIRSNNRVYIRRMRSARDNYSRQRYVHLPFCPRG